MKVLCFNIKYEGRDSIMFIFGPSMLQNFVEKGFAGMYNGDSAPKRLEIDLKLPDNYLDDLDTAELLVKAKLEEETGLKIKSFSFTIPN